jgi:hypothetical protein
MATTYTCQKFPDHDTISEYRDGIATGIAATFYNDRNVIVERLNGKLHGMYQVVFKHEDKFIREYIDDKPINDGIYMDSKGNFYKEMISRKTANMWNGIGNMWESMSFNSELSNNIIMLPITLVGLSISSVATASALIASPITGIIDKVKRNKNKIQLSEQEKQRIKEWNNRCKDFETRYDNYKREQELIKAKELTITNEKRYQERQLNLERYIYQTKLHQEIKHIREQEERAKIRNDALNVINNYNN